jgi:hypothetical protein
MNMSLSCAHTLHRTGVTCTLPGTRSCCAYDSTTPFEAPLPLLLPSALCTVDCAVLNGVRGYAVGETRVYVSSLPYSWHLMPCLVRVYAHLIPPRVAQCLLQSMYSRGSCSSSVTFPYRGKLLPRETSAAFPSTSGPLLPPGSGDVPLTSWGHSSHHERSAASMTLSDGDTLRGGYGDAQRDERLSEH